MAAPSGTVTFVFTDIVGSTRLWEAVPDAMAVGLARHDEILRGGDRRPRRVRVRHRRRRSGRCVLPGRRRSCRRRRPAALGGEPWPDAAAIRVRMGIHTGEATERDGDYFGPTVNRAARLMAVGHGGQILCSAATATLPKTSLSRTLASTDCAI